MKNGTHLQWAVHQCTRLIRVMDRRSCLAMFDHRGTTLTS